MDFTKPELCKFQSTRPLGAQLPPHHLSSSRHLVSIHAPAWGATIAPERQAVSALVSIHAPAWGATPAPALKIATGACFNPRARVGRDRGRPGTPCRRSRFNPRARVGRDQISSRIILTRSSFNPRARVGRDGPARRRLSVHRVSIHAPAWGATVSVLFCLKRGLVSIHAPAWGATVS